MSHLKTRTKNSGDVVNYTNNTSALQVGGTPVKIGNKTAILLNDVAVGKSTGANIVKCVFGRKDTSTFVPGDQVYFNATGDPVVGTAGSGAWSTTPTDLPGGECIVAAATGDEEVEFLLNEGQSDDEIHFALQKQVLEEDVVFTVAVASKDLSADIPAGAVIVAITANLETLFTATTAVKVGIGIAADPDKYGKTADLIKNSKITVIPAHAVLASAEDIKVFAVDTNGAAAGTLDTGTIKVRIYYVILNALDDAA